VTGKLTPTPLSMAAQETTTVQSSDAVKKPPRELKHLPPISGGTDRRRNNGATTVGTDLAVRMAKAWMRHALAKQVSAHMLKRSTPPPPVAADDGSSRKKHITCHCLLREAPAGPALRAAPGGAWGRAWMRAQRHGCSGGGGECAEAEVVAPP
jgi:hypothetical protein